MPCAFYLKVVALWKKEELIIVRKVQILFAHFGISRIPIYVDIVVILACRKLLLLISTEHTLSG